MMIQIEVKPETAALIAKAQEQGISVDQILHEALGYQTEDEPDEATPITFEEWDSVLQDLINSPAFSKAQVLPDDAFSRESIYTREDDIL